MIFPNPTPSSAAPSPARRRCPPARAAPRALSALTLLLHRGSACAARDPARRSRAARGRWRGLAAHPPAWPPCPSRWPTRARKRWRRTRAASPASRRLRAPAARPPRAWRSRPASASVSPTHTIGRGPVLIAATVLLATMASVSPRSCRRSLCPRIAQVAPASRSMPPEISPVNAAGGLIAHALERRRRPCLPSSSSTCATAARRCEAWKDQHRRRGPLPGPRAPRLRPAGRRRDRLRSSSELPAIRGASIPVCMSASPGLRLLVQP